MTTTNGKAHQELNGGIVTQRLVERGFQLISQSADGTHVLLRRDHIDVVVPGPFRLVPSIVAEMIERSLEPALGPKWLSENDHAEELTHDEVVILDVVVLEPSDDDLWRAFLIDDLSTVGYASNRSGALADLKSAAALRIGRNAEQIVLVTPDIL